MEVSLVGGQRQGLNCVRTNTTVLRAGEAKEGWGTAWTHGRTLSAAIVPVL